MDYITGRHRVCARGVCEQYGIGYLSATNEEEYRQSLATLLNEKTDRPIVMEVFTDVETDQLAVDELNALI